MALLNYTVTHTTSTPTLAAPTVSETISAPDDDTYLMVVVGGTGTVVTLVQPGTDEIGENKPDKVSASLTNTTKFFKVDSKYRDPTTGLASVTFSQVTGVTAAVLRMK